MFKKFSLVYLFPMLVLCLGVLNITMELDRVADRANATFERNFSRDAMRREGMRNILTSDVREFLGESLTSVASIDFAADEVSDLSLLDAAFEPLNLHLNDRRYQFFRVLLIEIPSDQSTAKIVRRAYPSNPSVEGLDIRSHPALLNFDTSAMQPFASSDYLAMFNDDPILAIDESQPVVVRRLVLRPGFTTESGWLLVVSSGLSAVHRSIDYIGSGMLDGATQILVRTYQPGTDRCMFVYEVRVGPRGCDHPIDSGFESYRTEETTSDSGLRIISEYLPTPTYRSLQDVSDALPNPWSVTLPIVTAFLLFLGILFSQSRRRALGEQLRETQLSLDNSQALSVSVFESMTARLSGMVEFAWSMYLRDPNGSEARYYRLATQNFSDTWLNLDRLYLLEDRKREALNIPNWETFNKDRISLIADRFLTVVTTDSDVEARLLIDHELPEEISCSGYWFAAALAGAIMASAETTETGFIEVRVWAEEGDKHDVDVCCSVHDTGIGWTITSPALASDPMGIEKSEAVATLKVIVEKTSVELVAEHLLPTRNEHSFRLTAS
ncbi:MAG: hypothetical protein L7S45_07425 [Luminiphilus sp.]|nr:hypothetical protein [Luminiphilus sp.]